MNGIFRFNTSNSWESPARSTSSLVFNFLYSSFSSPVYRVWGVSGYSLLL